MGKLNDLLNKKDIILCGEGYLFEMQRRGYVSIGPLVPLVVLEHPESVKELHREFARCGSDIIEAFTYYGHREKLRLIGEEDKLEKLNRVGCRLAREVADEFPGTLVAGNVSNSTIWDPENKQSQKIVEDNLREQIQWAKEEGVDFIIGETFGFLDEALLALRLIREAGLEAVITLAVNSTGKMEEGTGLLSSIRQLEAGGTTIAGFNCTRGPDTMLTILKEVAGKVKIPLAALPVTYNTTTNKPTMQMLSDKSKLYMDLEPHTCTRFDMADFAQKAAGLPGIKYLGVCCGASPYHLRSMATALGKECEATKYKADLNKHFINIHKGTKLANQFFG